MPSTRQLTLTKDSSLEPSNRADNFVSAYWKCGSNWIILFGISLACVISLSSLFSVPIVLQQIRSKSFSVLPKGGEIVTNYRRGFTGELPSQSVGLEQDNSADGLLAKGFEMNSCLSRYQSSLYRKTSPYEPSAHLLSKLRSYEALHKRCGPHTSSYNIAVELLKPSQLNTSMQDCNYLVWTPREGLGNRILSLTSTFLYALITDRVLLIDRGTDITDLFCEPFPETSWLLPLDFPLIKQLHNFRFNSSLSYGNMLRNNKISNSSSSYPPWLFLNLLHNYDDFDKHFFRDQDQSFIQRAPWLIVKSNNYFLPSLFSMPSFEQQLNNLFPQKETVFHFLGQYLFHPINSVWGLITRYYDAYLAKADEKIGIQIRVFDEGTGPFQHVLDQILACTIKEGILPELAKKKEVTNLGINQKSKVVLVTSLSSGYSERLKRMYWENARVNQVVSIHQPSHEEQQQTDNLMHDQKAWAEMYLLSLTDVLVTSSWSTFGYVAQGLGGLKPWILHRPENQTVPNPPCSRAMSMEPCFHAPPFYDWKTRSVFDHAKLVPPVTHCEDVIWGLKLVDS